MARDRSVYDARKTKGRRKGSDQLLGTERAPSPRVHNHDADTRTKHQATQQTQGLGTKVQAAGPLSHNPQVTQPGCQAPDSQPGPLTRLALRWGKGGPLPLPPAHWRGRRCPPCGYRDLIVLPCREETGELSSGCILELAEKNIWKRKRASETNTPSFVPALTFFE